MRNRPLIALLGVIGVLASHSAFGAGQIEESLESIGFSSHDHMIFASQSDTTDKTASPAQYLMHENRLAIERGVYRMGIHFTNRLLVQDSQSTSVTSKPFTLEKKILSGEWDRWTLQLGDSYQEFGKGIALSLYQDDNFGINNTLEGGSAKYHANGTEVSGFAGRVNPILAPVAVNAVDIPLKDTTLWLFGGSVGGKLEEDTRLSAHYVLALNQPTNYAGFNKTWTTVGVTGTQNNLIPDTEIYGETNVLVSHINVSGVDRELPHGWGSFASVSWAPSPWKLRLEGKHYEDYDFEFRKPPTLEDDVVETSNIQNVSATRLSGDRKTSVGTFGGSYLLGYDRLALAPIHHWVLSSKAKIETGWDVEGKAGYRTLPERSWLAHASLKTKIKTAKGQYLEVAYRKQVGKSKLDLLPTPEDRNAWDISYSFADGLSANVGYEYLPENDKDVGQHFFNIGSSVRWGQLSAKGMLGQTSGGTVCSAGVCRQVPPFSGALLETTYTF